MTKIEQNSMSIQLVFEKQEKNMKITKKKILKLFLYLAGLFLLFLLGLFLTLQYFFPSSFVKSQIESYIIDNYGISLKINDFDFSLFSGIEVSDFSIKDDDIPDSLFSFDSFQLDYDLLPLMDKKLVVNKLSIQHPKISIVKDKDGKFNFDGIIEKLTKGKQTAEEPEKLDDGSKSDFVVNLENLEINNIEVLYDDQSLETPMKVKLPRYNLSLRDVKFKSIDDMKVDLSISTGEENSLSFADKDNSVDLNQNLQLDVHVVNEDINIKLSHTLNDIFFKNKEMKIENIESQNVSLEAYYNLKTDSLNIDKLGINLADMISAKLSGKISNLSSSQIVDISLSKLEIDLAKTLDIVKENNLAELPPIILTDSKFLIKDLSMYHEVSSGNTEVTGTAHLNSSKTTYREKDMFTVVNDLISKLDFELSLNTIDPKLQKNIISFDTQIGDLAAKVQNNQYRMNDFKTKIIPVLNEDYQPNNIALAITIGNILNGNMQLNADIDLSKLTDYSTNSIIQELILDLKLIGNRLELSNITEAIPGGLSLSFSEEINMKNAQVHNKLKLNTVLNQLSEYDNIYSPIDNFEANSYFSANLKKFADEIILLDTLNIQLADFSEINISEVNLDLKNSILDIGNFMAEIDLPRTLNLAKQTEEPAIAHTTIDKGQFEINAQGKFNYADMTGSGNADISMQIENLSHDNILIKNYLKINEKIIANENNISLVGDINISDFDYDGLLKSYDIKGDINIENSITYLTSGEIRINKAVIELPDINTSASLTGKANISTKVPSFNLEFQHNIGLRKEYPVVSQLKNIKGFISGTTKISGDTNYVYTINHIEGIKGFNTRIELDSAGTQYAQINNMNIQFPFNLTMKLPEYDISRAEFITEKMYDDDIDFREYSENRDTYAKYGLPTSTITADEIEIHHPMLKDKMKNLDVDMYYEDNQLTINRYYFELLDGNATGFVKLDLGKGKLDDSIMKRAVLDLSFMASGMNTYYLANKENSEEASTELNITMALNSQGLDILNNPNLNGEVNISKISSGDAKYLLDFLNKSSGDQTAGMVKNMLNLFPGIKVDLFSFKIKNNFLYTLIKLKKPWYLFYFPLADEIKLSKQSLKFYIDKYVVEE
ncbi:MAG: hypothetical protein PF574_08780 [Candidatus Delongbacteria bacterium]|jgi:hypothetical protein|nr:hypothetical protein [Candidatus Delongbacteria bacterium]